MDLSDLLDDAADYSKDFSNVRVYLARRLDGQGRPLMEGKVRRDDIGMVALQDEYKEVHLIPVEICGDNGQYTAASFARMAETEPGLKSHALMARTFEIRKPGSDRVSYSATSIIGSVCYKQEDGTLEMWLLLFPPEQWENYFGHGYPTITSTAASPPFSDG